MRVRATALLLLASLLGAAPARAAWRRSDASGQKEAQDATPLPLMAVWMASPEVVWAVGGTTTRPLVIRSGDFFTSAEIVPSSTHGAPKRLNTVFATLSGGEQVHAFGDAGARASLASGTWTSANIFGTSTITIRSSSFVSPTLGYLAGTNSMTGVYLARWEGGLPQGLSVNTAEPTMTVVAYTARDTGFAATQREVFKHAGSTSGPQPGASKTITASGFTSLSLSGTWGVAVGSNATTSIAFRYDAGTGLWSAPNPAPNFTRINGVWAAGSGFAVAVGEGGAIAESHDEGRSWIRKVSPTSLTLRSVHCVDSETCVAVGDGAELLFYRNEAPDADVSTTLGSLTVEEGAEVCLVATNADPDGDPVSWLWTDPTPFRDSGGTPVVDGSTSATPPCFGAPTDVCTQGSYPFTVTVDDGRRSTDVPVTLVVNHKLLQPPTQPEIALPPEGSVWELGKSYLVRASSTAECGRTVSFEWSGTGPLPSPSVAGVDKSEATFDLSRPTTCDVGPATITATAQDPGGTPSRSVPITVKLGAIQPLVGVRFPEGFQDGGTVLPGTSVEIGIDAAHPCPGTWAYAWDCGAGWTIGDVDRFAFENPGGLCSDKPVSCRVTAAPEGHPSSQASFSLVLAAGLSKPQATLQFPSGYADGSPIQPGTPVEVRVQASHPCGAALSYQWDCGPGFSIGDVDRFSFENPGTLCTEDQIACTVTVTPAGGHPAEKVAFTLRRPAQNAAPTVSLVFPEGMSDGAMLAPDRSAEIQVQPSHACASEFGFAWDCGPGFAIGDVDRFVFSNPGTLCAEDVIACTVTVTPKDGRPSGSASFTLGRAAMQKAPALALEFPAGLSDGGVLAAGSSAEIVARASHPCGAEFAYDWDCGADWPVGHADRFQVSNPSGRCQGDTVTCEVTATAPNQPAASAGFSLQRAAALFAPTASLAFPAGLADGAVLAPGAQAEVRVEAAHCAPLGYRWDCGPAFTFVELDRRTFANPGRLCADSPVACTVTVTPEGGHPSTTLNLGLTLAHDLFPPTLSAAFSGGVSEGSVLSEGQAATATVAAAHCPGAELEFAWSSCEGRGAVQPAPGDTAVLFAHPGRAPPICESGQGARCEVTVTPTVSGAAHPSAKLSVGVEWAPAFAPPSALSIEVATAGAAPGDEVRLSGRANGDCSAALSFTWRVARKSSPDDAFFEGTGAEVRFPVPDVCGKDALVVTLSEEATGLSAATELAVASKDGPPVIRAQDSATVEPGPEPMVDCRLPATVTVRPTFEAACAPRFAWRQLTNLPVDLVEVDGGRALEVRPRLDQFGALAGQTARFEFSVEDAAGAAEPEVFEVRFVPRRFVAIEHRADRLASQPGEEVRLAARLNNRCGAALPGADVHLSLAGLEYLEGSARLDGRPLPDPEVREGVLAFKAIPLPGADSAAPVLTYGARRQAFAKGLATSTATAHLTVDPEIVISEMAEAEGGAGGGAGLGVVACRCDAAGGALAWWLAVASLAAVGRRKRAC